jgi:ornithine decarboxylase
MDYSTALALVKKHGTPTLFLSGNRVRESYRNLAAALPGVIMYYAVKSNALPQILNILKSEGASFDVCTNGEIDIVKSCGISGRQCLHTHPVKRDSDLKYALGFGIDTFVADNQWELQKLVPYRKKLKVLIRLSIQNPHCLVNLSQKFGIEPDRAFDLIMYAHKLGLNVDGIAFHTGSQNEQPLKYIEALEYCRDICKKAALRGVRMRTIDIGGGFPIDYLSPVMSIQQFCQPINEYLEKFFSDYRIIAEPGRHLSGPCMTLATRVIGKSIRDGVRWYYIDEGLYGSLSGKVFDHADYPMFVARGGKKRMSTIAGPTCDSFDVPYQNISLPQMEIGDLLLFDSMGSYTNASATTFNGFPLAKIVMVD